MVGKLRAKDGRKQRKKGDKRIVKFKEQKKDEPDAGPSSSQAAAEAR